MSIAIHTTPLKRKLALKSRYRVGDFMEPARDRELVVCVTNSFSNNYRVNGRVVNGISLAALIDHLRQKANPGWYGLPAGYAMEARLISLGFKVDSGVFIRRNNTPTRVVYTEG